MKRERERNEQQKLAPIRVHVATEPTFTRYVFDVSDHIGVSADRDKNRLILNFDTPLTFDLGDADAALPNGVQEITSELDDDTSLVRFILASNIDVRTFRDEQGAELFDLPSAPRPGEDVPAPVRLAAEFDNLLLSHADRSRVVHPDHLQRFYTINGIFPGSVLIDGFVAGMWRLARTKSAATLTIELFGSWRERAQVGREAERMLAFCASPPATMA